MRLWEILEDKSLIQQLRDDVTDLLLPLAAHGVPFITVQAIEERLRDINSGVVIDRSLVMQVIDPDVVKLITRIEGDKVYFKVPLIQHFKSNVDTAAKDKMQVHNAATKQAKKNISASS